MKTKEILCFSDLERSLGIATRVDTLLLDFLQEFQ